MRRFLLVGVLSAWAGGVLAADTAVYRAPAVVSDFRVSFSVSFAKGEAVKCWMKYQYDIGKDIPEKDCWWSEVHVEFDDVSRVYGRADYSRRSGCPYFTKWMADGIRPEPGEKRRVEIVHKGEWMSVYQEVGGKMQLFNRTCLSANVRLRAVSFAGAKGTVTDVKLSAADGAEDPTPVVESFDLPADGSGCSFAFRSGRYPAEVSLVFPDGTKKPLAVTMTSFRQEFSHVVKEKKRKEVDGVPFFQEVAERKYHNWPDSGLEVKAGNGPARRVFSRTRIGGRYRDNQMADILAHPEQYGKSASEHVFRCEIRRSPAGGELWLDDNFVCPLALPPAAKRVAVTLPNGAKVKLLDAGRARAPREPLAPLELAVRSPFDTSLCHMDLGSFQLECDGYLSREPTDALPGAFLRRVPAATYNAAVLKVRVDPAPTNTCLLTARLTNFCCPHTEGRSPEAIAQTMVQLERKGGVQEVTVPLDVGRIQNLIHDHPDGFLDFEVLGGIATLIDKLQSCDFRPDGKPTGVTLLAAKLVRAPAGLNVRNGAYRNLFVAGEATCVTACVDAVRSGSYELVWEERDVDGKRVSDGRKTLTLAAGEKAAALVPFKARTAGWYGYTVSLREKGAPIVAFEGSFAVVGTDTRKAGFESPYYTWDAAGLADRPTFRRQAAYLKKLGIRRARLQNYSEEDAKDFGLTLGECHAIRVRGSTQAEKEANFEADARAAMKKWPHIRTALIGHEHYGSVNPSELYGKKTELTPAQLATQKQNVEDAIWRARVWRKVAPHVKLKLGNAGSSLSIMGDYFRGGYPKDLIDLIGEENVGQMKSPERETGWNFRNLKDLAELYGYTNAVSACYEWKSRARRLYESPRKQAAWLMRDVLIALAWKAELVTVVTGPEIGNSYFNSCWGDGALTCLDQPLPLLPAVANVTRVLDRCTFVRLVPTGSQTVYLLEFERGAGDVAPYQDGDNGRDARPRASAPHYVYATWTARGQLEATFQTAASSILVTDFYGRDARPRASAGSFRTPVSEEPSYFTMDGPIVAADASGGRAYPREDHPGLAGRRTLAALASLGGWKGDTNVVERFGRCYESGRPAAAVFADGKGCVDVTLVKEKPCPPLLNEYCFLRAPAPIPVPDEATTLCLDVKGNSSWSKLMFEIEDAKGRKWWTAGPSCDYFDLSDTLAMNFDGWHTLQFQIRPESPAKCYSLGSNMRQWSCQTAWSAKELAYPLKVTAVGFKFRRWGFDLLNWIPTATDTISVKNLSAY